MRASTIFASAAAFAVASAQSSSVDPFPQTNLLAQTNSLGVITGQFSVATAIPTQPAADTEQPPAATDVGTVETIPAVGTGVHTLTLPGPASNVNATRTIVVSANNSTTVVLGAPTSSGAVFTSPGASGSGASRTPGASGSPTGSGAPQQSTGAAAQVVAGSFLGFGAFLAAFL
ncbi:hypothetical protein IQ07DRAFT_680166 [Pyrenochaeta sp. DS3sAY3a]|nr:hypothetical protein IQ07DRAFT_680166 [Pyrenochaeta sp. DS3sAY3a]